MYLLCVAIFFSTILLIGANHAARTSSAPVDGVLKWVVILPFVAMVSGRVSFTVLIQAALFGIGALFISESRRNRFLPISLAATAMAYGIVGAWAAYDLHTLRATFPIESLEARLPVLRSDAPDRLDEKSTADLLELEYRVLPFGGRESALKNLHENAVEVFAARNGFGIGRMHVPGEARLTDYPAPDPTFAANASPSSTDALSAGRKDSPKDSTPEAIDGLRSMHLRWLPAFLRPDEGYGYFRDRAHVVGFRAHGFRTWPPHTVRVRRIELVGLVVHPEPVVYLSGELPTMAKLATIPRRPLDAFETEGLQTLKSGDSLFARQAASGLRALGPIRAAKQCTECHGCERGRLLGAFSYTLAEADPAASSP
jgi:hypothetical protein